MKKSGATGVFLFLILAFAPCYAHHLALVVAKDNGVEAITSSNLAKILKAETRKWPDGKSVVVVLRRESLAQMQTLERLNKMSESDLRVFLAAHQDSVVLTDTDVDLLKMVVTIPGAIGLVDVRSINDKVKVVRVDGKLPLEDGYLPHH
ncbi:MAG TPA: hypothetical protein VKY85_23325 [Candidatus Angelobacter sp.]|nr:hypothetical protein [Candidatus Angelobacter sp.]